MSDNNNKRELISEGVGLALDRLFGNLEASNEDEAVGSSLTMSVTDNGVLLVNHDTQEEATGGDVIDRMQAFFEEVAFQDTDNAIYQALKCRHCNLFPCVLNRECDNMLAIASNLQEEGKTNKEIRFALYTHFSQVYHGHLGAGNRMPLPTCVVGEIRDHYPKDEGTEYVGFKTKDDSK